LAGSEGKIRRCKIIQSAAASKNSTRYHAGRDDSQNDARYNIDPVRDYVVDSESYQATNDSDF
jgi:hypothetical protein